LGLPAGAAVDAGKAVMRIAALDVSVNPKLPTSDN
jgi:hypothetical protein